jgi:ATP-binding cassette subfamily C protein
MTSVPESVPEQDVVLGALGGLGAPVDCTGLTRLDLQGPQVLWLVVSGALDLFAVDAAAQGHWHHLGRLEPGSLLLGPVAGPQHTLVARPVRDCVVRRIGLRELYQPAQTQTWSYDEYGNPVYVPPQSSPLEYALALGVGRSLSVLFQAPLAEERPAEDGAGPAGVGDDDVFWMQVPPGSVQYGSLYGAEAAADLLIDPAVWQGMVGQQYRLLSALDRWIERLERAHEDRAAAGIAAGEAVRAQADRTLLASIGRSSARRTTAADADATYAACRLVARASGIALADSSQLGTASDRLDPVERIAQASRVRTRAVRLRGRWWRENVGPLVGHRALSGAPVALLWRRGGYVAVHPATGRETPVEKANAEEFEPRAVMFYRPLPDRPLGPLGLLRFSLRGTSGDLANLLLSGLVTVALGALVPIATGKVLGTYVPRAQTGLIAQVCLAVMVAGVVAAAFTLLENLTLLRLEGRIEATLQPAVWDRLLRLPTRFFTRRSTGELAGAAMGISAIRRLLAGVAPVIAQSVTVGAVNLGLLLWYSVPMALAALDQQAVRRQCGVVLQHAQPFSGSILDVIRGTEPCTPEEAMAAAEMAGLAEDIRRMPMGLHTIVSGSGAISGGQRQRLMIAQALVRRPRILFLDEATSALDNETQRTVIESTRKLNATRVVIAHRLSTVLDADRVIVMEDGRIVQQGTPAELLADTGGRLHELVRRQMA